MGADLLETNVYLWADDTELGSVVYNICLGKGVEDMADDLVRLSDLFLARWSQAEGKIKASRSSCGGGIVSERTPQRSAVHEKTQSVHKKPTKSLGLSRSNCARSGMIGDLCGAYKFTLALNGETQ